MGKKGFEHRCFVFRLLQFKAAISAIREISNGSELSEKLFYEKVEEIATLILSLKILPLIEGIRTNKDPPSPLNSFQVLSPNKVWLRVLEEGLQFVHRGRTDVMLSELPLQCWCMGKGVQRGWFLQAASCIRVLWPCVE